MYEQPPISVACVDVSGIYAGNLKYTDLDSVKDCRTRVNAKQPHRLKTNVRPTGGRVHLEMTRNRSVARNRRVARKPDWQPTAGTIWEAWRAHAR